MKVKKLTNLLGCQNLNQFYTYIDPLKLTKHCYICEEKLGNYEIKTVSEMRTFYLGLNEHTPDERAKYPNICEKCRGTIVMTRVLYKEEEEKRKQWRIKRQEEVEGKILEYEKMNTKQYYQTKYWSSFIQEVLLSIRKCQLCFKLKPLAVISVDETNRGLEQPIIDYNEYFFCNQLIQYRYKIKGYTGVLVLCEDCLKKHLHDTK